MSSADLDRRDWHLNFGKSEIAEYREVRRNFEAAMEILPMREPVGDEMIVYRILDDANYVAQFAGQYTDKERVAIYNAIAVLQCAIRGE